MGVPSHNQPRTIAASPTPPTGAPLIGCSAGGDVCTALPADYQRDTDSTSNLTAPTDSCTHPKTPTKGNSGASNSRELDAAKTPSLPQSFRRLPERNLNQLV